MNTLGFWLYDELLPLIANGNERATLEAGGVSYQVTATSSRLKCLKRSPKCATCRLTGEVWMLQTHGELGRDNEMRPHLNLYALNKKDNFVLMTQDHIYPKSLGGTSVQSNLQTMCTACNQRKGATVPDSLKGDFSNPNPEKLYEQHSPRDTRDLAERSFRVQRLRTLSAYADYLAVAEKLSA